MTTEAETAGAEQPKPADWYDADYYGVGEGLPKANYRNYGQGADPSWARPLAKLIAPLVMGIEWTLDVGCAYGHLVRELRALGRNAHGIEWSPWAVARRLDEHVYQGDARMLADMFVPRLFRVVTSMDVIEHLTEADGGEVIEQMALLAFTGTVQRSYQIHLIGWHNPRDPLDLHMSDPSHVNHQPIAWYRRQFERHGYTVDHPLAVIFNTHPAWAHTDWRGRWLVMSRAAPAVGTA